MVSWRRRRPGGDPAEDGAAAGAQDPAAGAPADGAAGEPAGDPEEARVRSQEARRRALGPFDAAEVEPGRGRIDLGALRVTAPPGMELRLEVEEATKRVVAATLGVAGSSVQVHVFAAPRTDGVWEEVRGEIAASVEKQGGTAEVVDVPDGFGRELLARLPARTSDGRTGHVVTRFAGVDGPRWFLRAVFAGAAALDRNAAAPLEAVVRSIVVVRGEEAMAPRDLLPLHLPPGSAPRPAPAQAPRTPGAQTPAAPPPAAQAPAAPPPADPRPAAQAPAAAPPAAAPAPAPQGAPPVPVGPRAAEGGRS